MRDEIDEMFHLNQMLHQRLLPSSLNRFFASNSNMMILLIKSLGFFLIRGFNCVFQRHNKKKDGGVDDAGFLIANDDKLPAYEVKHSEIFGR